MLSLVNSTILYGKLPISNNLVTSRSCFLYYILFGCPSQLIVAEFGSTARHLLYIGYVQVSTKGVYNNRNITIENRYTQKGGLLIHCIAGEILTKGIKYRWPSSPDVRCTENSCQWHAKNSAKIFPFVIRKAVT